MKTGFTLHTAGEIRRWQHETELDGDNLLIFDFWSTESLVLCGVWTRRLSGENIIRTVSCSELVLVQRHEHTYRVQHKKYSPLEFSAIFSAKAIYWFNII